MRQLIGSTSHTTILPVPTTNTAAQESCLDDNDDINTSNNEVRPRLSSSHLDSRTTDMTTPIGMATPIAPNLVWPSHPDIQGTSLFPRDDDPTTVAAGGLDPEERWKYTTLMIFWEFEDLPWILLVIYKDWQRVKPW